jgi:hypothetical protein
MFRVYGLHAGDHRIVYVGSTARPLRLRRDWHIGCAHRGVSAPVARWIDELEPAGRRPEIVKLASAPTAEEAASIERALIEFHRERGDTLLNVRTAAYVPTIAHRIAISRAIRGRLPSRATRFRMSLAARRAWQRRRRDATHLSAIGGFDVERN